MSILTANLLLFLVALLGRADIMGAAAVGATVTVNSMATYRKGDYFRQEVAVPNNSYSTINVGSAAGAETGTASGKVFVPPATEAFTYDLDGNLLSDGRWNFTWDGENQLIRVESKTSPPIGSERRVEFEYDHRGRRIQKRSYSGSPFVLNSNLKFVYDDWNLLAELNESNNTPVRWYLWGLDVAGSVNFTGGVGALISVTDATQGTHFSITDGSGNVSGLINAATGARSATYEYDPFGQTLRKSGTAADLNPLRYSSRYADSETEFVYYGFRYYAPATGRWLNRDPIEEWGGLNLYGMLDNDPVNFVDLLGLYILDEDGFPVEESYHGGGAYLHDAEAKAAHDEIICEGIEKLKNAVKQAAVAVTTVTPIPGDEVAAAAMFGGIVVKGARASRVTKLNNGIQHSRQGFSNGNFGNAVHQRFQDALTQQTRTRTSDWSMRTRPGQTGVDATYVGPASRNPGFKYAELKPNSPGSLSTFGNPLGNWNLTPGKTELWLYNNAGIIGSSGFRF